MNKKIKSKQGLTLFWCSYPVLLPDCFKKGKLHRC